MKEHRIGIIMNGVTGRMGTNQHLLRSIKAIIDQGGIRINDEETIMPDPILLASATPPPSPKNCRTKASRSGTAVVVMLTTEGMARSTRLVKSESISSSERFPSVGAGRVASKAFPV